MGKIPFEGNPIGYKAEEGGMPTSGLIFYAPLKNASATVDETGTYTLTNSNMSNDFHQGITCIKSSNEHDHILTNFGYYNIPSTGTWSIWVNMEDAVRHSGYLPAFFSVGQSSASKFRCEVIDEDPYHNVNIIFSSNKNLDGTNVFSSNQWYHILFTYINNGTGVLYVNGTQVTSATVVKPYLYSADYIRIGGLNRSWNQVKYLAAARIYNRVLTDDEIKLLSQEFHPITKPSFGNQSIVFNESVGAESKQLTFNTYGKDYDFSIISGTLPSSVTFDTSGTFTYDGSPVAQTENYSIGMSLSGEELLTVSADVALSIENSALPTDYIAHISTSGYSEYADTGQALTFYNVYSENYKTYANIPCIDMTSSDSQAVRLEELSMNSGTDKPRSYSVWLAMTDYYPNNMRAIAIGQFDSHKELCSPNNPGYSYVAQAGGHSYDVNVGYELNKGQWYHFVQNYYANGDVALYIDGNFIVSGNSEGIDIDNHMLSLGSPTNVDWDCYFIGYVADAKLYNRTLTDTEISALFNEHTPSGYQIEAYDLYWDVWPSYSEASIQYSCVGTPTFEIVSGTLPSEISFDTSTGVFSGSAPTDQDHYYELTVRISSPVSTPIEVKAYINTYATARIEFYGGTINFTTEASESYQVGVTYSDEPVTIAYYSGTMPSGVTFSNDEFISDGTQYASETQTVTLIATSEHNQGGVTTEFTLNVNMNELTITKTNYAFYADKSATSTPILYSTTNPITPVYSLTGTLPNGVTFNNGTFTSDPSLILQDASSVVSATIASQTGLSIPDTKELTVSALLQSPPYPTSGLTFYDSFSNANCLTTPEIGNSLSAYQTSPTFTTEDGITCIHCTGNGGLIGSANGYFDTNNSIFTMSVWIKQGIFPIVSDNGNGKAFSIGDWTVNGSCEFGFDKSMKEEHYELSVSRIALLNYEWDNAETEYPISAGWHHYLVTCNGNTNDVLSAYIDGVYRYYKPFSTYENNVQIKPIIGFGGNFTYYTNDYPYGMSRDPWFNGYIAAARIYDRVLTAEEIQQLAEEFTPTT